ncbi:MAG: hypothetical protein RL456_779 [Pseudomonadota bacterium]|jgi:carbon monoxide dehydrogenase subunit G
MSDLSNVPSGKPLLRREDARFLTGADIAASKIGGLPCGWLMHDKVRHVGDQVALVVAGQLHPLRLEPEPARRAAADVRLRARHPRVEDARRQGGMAGHGKGSADVMLAAAEAEGHTVLTCVARAQVGGKIAQIGSRLADTTPDAEGDDGKAKKSWLPWKR